MPFHSSCSTFSASIWAHCRTVTLLRCAGVPRSFVPSAGAAARGDSGDGGYAAPVRRQLRRAALCRHKRGCALADALRVLPGRLWVTVPCCVNSLAAFQLCHNHLMMCTDACTAQAIDGRATCGGSCGCMSADMLVDLTLPAVPWAMPLRLAHLCKAKNSFLKCSSSSNAC